MVGKSPGHLQVGYMSGESNVTAWLAERGYEPSPALVAEVFRAAKGSKRTLHDDEILAIVRGFTSAPGEA
jgi:isopropylmalate/homocitrate/citramalate synthase